MKKAPASIAKPSVGVGAWLGAALAYVVSDVVPQIICYWMERRRQPRVPLHWPHDPWSAADVTARGSFIAGAGKVGGHELLFL